MAQLTIENWDYTAGSTITQADAPYTGDTDDFTVVSDSSSGSDVDKALELDDSDTITGGTITSMPSDPSLPDYPKPGDTITVQASLASGPDATFRWARDEGSQTQFYEVRLTSDTVELSFFGSNGFETLDSASWTAPNGWFTISISWGVPSISVDVASGTASLSASDDRLDTEGGVQFGATTNGTRFGMTEREPSGDLTFTGLSLEPTPDGRTATSPRRGFRLAMDVTVENNSTVEAYEDVTADLAEYVYGSQTVTTEQVFADAGESKTVRLEGPITATPGAYDLTVSGEANSITEQMSVGETEMWLNTDATTSGPSSSDWAWTASDNSAIDITTNSAKVGKQADIATGNHIEADPGDVAAFNDLTEFGEGVFPQNGSETTFYLRPNTGTLNLYLFYGDGSNHLRFEVDGGTPTTFAVYTVDAGVEQQQFSTEHDRNITGLLRLTIGVVDTSDLEIEFIDPQGNSINHPVTLAWSPNAGENTVRLETSIDSGTLFGVASGPAGELTPAESAQAESSGVTASEFTRRARKTERFEHTDLSKYSGDTGAFSIQTTDAAEGNAALEHTGSSFSEVFADASEIGHTPGVGDEFRFRIKSETVAGSEFTYFAVQDTRNWYALEHGMSQDRLRLLKARDGFISVLGGTAFDATDASGNSAWLEIRVEWRKPRVFDVTAFDINGVERGFEAVDPTPRVYTSGSIGFASDGVTVRWDDFKVLTRNEQTVTEARSNGIAADEDIVHRQDTNLTTTEIDAVSTTDHGAWILANENNWNRDATDFPPSPEPHQAVTDRFSYIGPYAIHNRPTGSDGEVDTQISEAEAVSFRGGSSSYWDVQHDSLNYYPKQGDTFAFYFKTPEPDADSQSDTNDPLGEFPQNEFADVDSLSFEFRFGVQDYYRSPDDSPHPWAYDLKIAWFGAEADPNGEHLTTLRSIREFEGERGFYNLDTGYMDGEDRVERGRWYRAEIDWGNDYTLSCRITDAATGEFIEQIGGVDVDDGTFTRYTEGGIAINNLDSQVFVDEVRAAEDTNLARADVAQGGSLQIAADLAPDLSNVLGRRAFAEVTPQSPSVTATGTATGQVAQADASGVQADALGGPTDPAADELATFSEVTATLADITDIESRFGSFQFGEMKFGTDDFKIAVTDSPEPVDATASGVQAGVTTTVTESGSAQATASEIQADALGGPTEADRVTTAQASGVQADAIVDVTDAGSVEQATASEIQATLTAPQELDGTITAAVSSGAEGDTLTGPIDHVPTAEAFGTPTTADSLTGPTDSTGAVQSAASGVTGTMLTVESDPGTVVQASATGVTADARDTEVVGEQAQATASFVVADLFVPGEPVPEPPFEATAEIPTIEGDIL